RPPALPWGQPGRDGLYAAPRGPGPRRPAGRAAPADRVLHADGRHGPPQPRRPPGPARPAPVRLRLRRQRDGVRLAARAGGAPDRVPPGRPPDPAARPRHGTQCRRSPAPPVAPRPPTPRPPPPPPPAPRPCGTRRRRPTRARAACRG